MYNKQIIALFLLANFATWSFADISGWRDCGSTATIHRVTAGDCSVAPCPFRRGDTYQIEVEFTSRSQALILPYSVNATMLGQVFNIMQGDGCDQLPCPTVIDFRKIFQYTYQVLTIFPPVPTTAITEVRNHLNQIILCFRLDIQIN